MTRQWCGIRTVGRDYPVTAIVATIAHEKPHDGVAHEYFLPAGPFAILPLTHNRANIVWAEPHAVAEALLAMPESDFLAELERRAGSVLGRIGLEGPRFGYRLGMQIAERMIDARVALAGDSAHAIHPIAGQGLNLGLRDVAALAECIADSRTDTATADAGDAAILERYAQWRRNDQRKVVHFTDTLVRLFGSERRSVKLLRNVGMLGFDLVPGVRAQFARHTMGLAGYLPRLSRGVPLE
jgi:2-octaprenyl-6-methoxyphenol hydroxylase